MHAMAALTRTVCKILRPHSWSRAAAITVATRQSLYSTETTVEESTDAAGKNVEDATAAKVLRNEVLCYTPKDVNTNVLDFLNRSDMQKRANNINIPFFTPGSYLAVIRSDPYSPTGISKFFGICIARHNKGLGSTFVLRNVIGGVGVETMYELYSPAIKEIKVLKLERRRRAKLYYLRDKPSKYSTVNENMEPVKSDEVSVYRRKGAPA